MGYTSEIRKTKTYVEKRVVRAKEFGVVDREYGWLSLMYDEPRTPIVMNRTGDVLRLTYVGEKLTKDNAPPDLKYQLFDIIDMLEKYMCNHNDINPGNLMVSDAGFVSIIDFQWALPKWEKIPDNWPKTLNEYYRADDDNIIDRYSVQKILEEMNML